MNEYLQRGQVAIQENNLAAAKDWFDKAVAKKPDDAQALACFGQTLCWLGERQKGLQYLRKSGRCLLKKARKNKDITQVIQMIEQLQHWGDYQGALELNKPLLQIKKDDVRVYQLLASIFLRLNMKEQAFKASGQALKLLPENPSLNILHATTQIERGRNDAAMQRLKKILQTTSLTPLEKFRAHKELAKLLDKTGKYHLVFQHLKESTTVSKRIEEICAIDAALVPEMVKENKQVFNKNLFNNIESQGNQKSYPQLVFLIGFLRSGTTLTQEVLGTQAKVFVADETDFIPGVRFELARISEKESYPEQIKSLTPALVQQLREYYWSRVVNYYGSTVIKKPVFVEKSTMNTMDLGLINCIFPDAKILFLLRDPRDVCLSCFMQIMKPTPTTVQFLEWRKTAQFYALIMDWWMYIKTQLTMEIKVVRYEDAVTEFEQTFRAVFGFLDLKWDASAIDFHRKAQGKYIESPSFSQVSRPLYQSSVARWRCYQSEFDEIIDILQPYIEKFGYE